MEIFMLAGALVATLGGVMALAFRVVRLPKGKSGKAGARTAKAGSREPVQVLLNHVTDEHTRHTLALREALDLRRSRNEAEARARLLNERILHVEAARRLGQHVQPTIGGRVRQWLDQARLDILVDTVRREVADVRFGAVPTLPLAGERGLGRLITWARGGPKVGAAHDLALYHREQREHYRLAVIQARRLARDQRQADARSHLATEQAHHLRVSRDLKRRLQPDSGPNSGLHDGADLYGATDPALTAILN
ncbi:MAG TPA: hypothetical protein VE338_00245 [Ktedonobacterales bacterium]|jgi:hypothetical protein|nr:hypothetical protein [Ktedonobacterales bacterium]